MQKISVHCFSQTHLANPVPKHLPHSSTITTLDGISAIRPQARRLIHRVPPNPMPSAAGGGKKIPLLSQRPEKKNPGSTPLVGILPGSVPMPYKFIPVQNVSVASPVRQHPSHFADRAG
ncbi:hypothetical protein J3458_007210 [Metarhizium acridum]|uniref:uncharacterized protein n=1 Tax=Metarhizium acridum TaxID=92637 RepID=UPI001C6C5C77|nr:hypothetical protein J3458_007210 [Metarhizium acridum]